MLATEPTAPTACATLLYDFRMEYVVEGYSEFHKKKLYFVHPLALKKVKEIFRLEWKAI